MRDPDIIPHPDAPSSLRSSDRQRQVTLHLSAFPMTERVARSFD